MNGSWLNHNIEMGEYPNYEKFINTIFSLKDRECLEYIIGGIASDWNVLGKLIILSGPPASGKSTLLNLIYEIFKGYICCISQSDLIDIPRPIGAPKLMIMHDFDPQKVENDEPFYRLADHSPIILKNRFGHLYYRPCNVTLFAATNSDKENKNAIILHTTGKRISPINSFNTCVHNMLENEIGHIIDHCIKVYRYKTEMFRLGLIELSGLLR